MRKLFINYVNRSHIIWLGYTSSNTQVIRNRGNRGTLFVVCRSAGASLQMTGGHNLVRLYALVIFDHCPHPLGPGECRGIMCLQFAIVTTTLWGQLAGKTMTVLPRSLLLYCIDMAAYVYQTPIFPPHYGDNVKVKSQHIYEGYPRPVQGLGCSSGYK